mgnify:CR=1 FL=1
MSRFSRLPVSGTIGSPDGRYAVGREGEVVPELMADFEREYGVEHVIKKMDGTISERNTYPRSRDKNPPKGRHWVCCTIR